MRSFFVVGVRLLWYNEESFNDCFRSEFVEVSPSVRQGKRALPGRSSLFWKSEPKSTRGCGPWTPGFIISARKDTLFLLSFPFALAIELLNRQRLRRNYESAIKPRQYVMTP